jgi:hypothetical protein
MQNKKEKKGVGKPTLYKKAMKRVNVMLDEDTVKFYTEQGKGNLSEGIRNHWRGLTKRTPDAGESSPAGRFIHP